MSDGAGTTTPSPRRRRPKPTSILGANDVTKVFGGLVAVSDISFAIPRKGIVSIIGPNGAGKTTFFNMLTGLYKPTTGEIAFDGKDVTRGRPDKILALGMSRTFQNIRLFATMTALENVMVGQHSRMKAGLRARSSARRAVRQARSGTVRDKAHELLESSASAGPRTTSSRSTWPTATSAGSRSPGRWRPIPSCCCWTSPRRA